MAKEKKEKFQFDPVQLKSKRGDPQYEPAGLLTRVEIMCTQALEEDFIEAFKKEQVAGRYTKLKDVMGAGYSNPCLGDAVWPQLNIMFLIFCTKEESEKIKDIVWELRDKYRTEGIACFISSAEEV